MQVSDRYVAQSDAVDQPFVAGLDQCGKLRVKARAGRCFVDQPQVDRCHPIHTERCEVLLDARPQLIRIVERNNGTAVVATGPNLADDRQVGRVRVQRFADELVHHTRPVVLRGIDVVDSRVDRRPQDKQRLVTVTWRPKDTITGQLHRAVPNPIDLTASKGECAGEPGVGFMLGHVG